MAARVSKLRRVLLIDMDVESALATGILEYARQAGWLIAASQHYPDLSVLDLARRWQVDGVIVGFEPRAIDVQFWQTLSFPIVATTGGPAYDHSPVPHVVLDFAASGRAAARHLLYNGFRNLAYCWLGDWWVLNDQMAGFRKAATAAGAHVNVLNASAAFSGDHSGSYTDTLRRWIIAEVAALPRPLGLMVESDWTGVEVVQALHEASIAVPEEVAVVSCYNIEPICEGAIVPLSSVAMNRREQGRRAAAVLDRLFRRRKGPAGAIWVKPEGVVARKSTDTTAAPHPGVAKAMAMIRERFHDPELTVVRLAEGAGISTVALNAAFNQHLGAPPSHRLREWRLKEAMALLATTNRSVQDVAAACGYGTVTQLIRRLKAATGLGPRAWRKAHWRLEKNQ